MSWNSLQIDIFWLPDFLAKCLLLLGKHSTINCSYRLKNYPRFHSRKLYAGIFPTNFQNSSLWKKLGEFQNDTRYTGYGFYSFLPQIRRIISFLLSWKVFIFIEKNVTKLNVPMFRSLAHRCIYTFVVFCSSPWQRIRYFSFNSRAALAITVSSNHRTSFLPSELHFHSLFSFSFLLIPFFLFSSEYTQEQWSTSHV